MQMDLRSFINFFIQFFSLLTFDTTLTFFLRLILLRENQKQENLLQYFFF